MPPNPLLSWFFILRKKDSTATDSTVSVAFPAFVTRQQPMLSNAATSSVFIVGQLGATAAFVQVKTGLKRMNSHCAKLQTVLKLMPL